MASMMEKVQMDKKMKGAYSGFNKPNPSSLVPVSEKLRVLNKADKAAKQQES